VGRPGPLRLLRSSAPAAVLLSRLTSRPLAAHPFVRLQSPTKHGGHQQSGGHCTHAQACNWFGLVASLVVLRAAGHRQDVDDPGRGARAIRVSRRAGRSYPAPAPPTAKGGALKWPTLPHTGACWCQWSVL